MKTLTVIPTSIAEQPNNSQLLRAQFEAQFETQSQIRNELSAKPFFRRILHILLNKTEGISPIDVAHQEANRVNNIVDELRPYKYLATAQILASMALRSSEFNLMDSEELLSRELLLRYCPESVEHIYDADINTAYSDLNKHICSRKMTKHNKRALRKALYSLTSDVVDTAISSGDTQTMVKLITNNELRYLGYFEGLIRFPKEIINLDSVQKSIKKSFLDCVSFEYDSNLKKYVNILIINGLLPEHIVQESLKARRPKDPISSNLAYPYVVAIPRLANQH